MQRLAAAPFLGSAQRLRNRKLAGIRTWTSPEFKNYVVYYRPVTNGIEVIRILHGARRTQRLLLESLEE
jgi:plasmid stabilization system protein ParE